MDTGTDPHQQRSLTPSLGKDRLAVIGVDADAVAIRAAHSTPPPGIAGGDVLLGEGNSLSAPLVMIAGQAACSGPVHRSAAPSVTHRSCQRHPPEAFGLRRRSGTPCAQRSPNSSGYPHIIRGACREHAAAVHLASREPERRPLPDPRRAGWLAHDPWDADPYESLLSALSQQRALRRQMTEGGVHLQLVAQARADSRWEAHVGSNDDAPACWSSVNAFTATLALDALEAELRELLRGAGAGTDAER